MSKFIKISIAVISVLAFFNANLVYSQVKHSKMHKENSGRVGGAASKSRVGAFKSKDQSHNLDAQLP